MRIAQVVLPTASEYERKSQRIDRAALSGLHVLVPLGEVRASGAQVAHIYATGELPRAAFVRFPVPYVASAGMKKTRWQLRKPLEPAYVVSPFELPEAVEDAWFGGGEAILPGGEQAILPAPGPVSGPVQGTNTIASPTPLHKIIGSFVRPSVRN